MLDLGYRLGSVYDLKLGLVRFKRFSGLDFGFINSELGLPIFDGNYRPELIFWDVFLL